MRHLGLILTVLAGFLMQTNHAHAQSSVDLLDKDLDDIKQKHTVAAAQSLTDFLSQLDQASQAPQAALDLYQKAGGTMPDSAPVQTKYANETPHEKDARLAVDAANAASLANILQIQCGLMRYAALFITALDPKSVQDNWIAWLKSAPPLYLQIKDIPPDPKSRKPSLIVELRKMTVRDSIIGGYLGFHDWDSKKLDRDPSKWCVKNLPELYRSDVLEPLRATPSAATLAAWDVYISLKNADQPDNDRWNQIEYPSFQFDRACDDYAITTDTEKLQTLIGIIKANPNHPKLDDMIARAHQLVDDYRSHHGGSAPPAPPVAGGSTPAAPTNNVTTTVDGDMTIITTHPTATTPPAPPAPVPAPAQ